MIIKVIINEPAGVSDPKLTKEMNGSGDPKSDSDFGVLYAQSSDLFKGVSGEICVCCNCRDLSWLYSFIKSL